MADCPDEPELRALSAGQVAAQRTVELVQHLVGCQRCVNATFPPGAIADTLAPPSGREGSLIDTAVTDEAPGRYQILRELGRGGQALVSVAFDRHLGREVA